MRRLIARCSVDYKGRLAAHLPEAVRLLIFKADGTFLIHSDSGSKPLNWVRNPSRVRGTGADLPGGRDSGPMTPGLRPDMLIATHPHGDAERWGS